MIKRRFSTYLTILTVESYGFKSWADEFWLETSSQVSYFGHRDLGLIVGTYYKLNDLSHQSSTLNSFSTCKTLFEDDLLKVP